MMIAPSILVSRHEQSVRKAGNGDAVKAVYGVADGCAAPAEMRTHWTLLLLL